MDSLFKSVKYYILLGYLALMAFLGVFYYDQPVHGKLASYLNEVCIGSSMREIAAKAGKNSRVAVELLQAPMRRYCDCFMPSPNNRMTYLKFASNYWENLSLSFNLGDKASDYRAIRVCAAELQAAVRLLGQYYGHDYLPDRSAGGTDLD